MRVELLPQLRCPQGCKGVLQLEMGHIVEERILSGRLHCQACSAIYMIEEGIPRMLPPHLQEASKQETSDEAERKKREMAARDEQVESYDKMKGLALFSKIEIPVTLRQMNLRPDDVLLEAGCGTGRMTPTFAALCRQQIAVDFSFESLRVCQRKLQAAGIENVDLVQADVCALPFQDALFTNVVSCQVLEHIPTPKSRSRMVSELARVALTGANVVLSAYQHSWWTRLFGKKEGEHTGGIYYYRFTRRELRALLSEHLEVQAMTGALVYHYLARCRKPKAP